MIYPVKTPNLSLRALVWRAISFPLLAFCLQACWIAPADAAFPKLADYPGGEAGLVVIVDPVSAELATDLALQSRHLVALLDEDPAKAGAHNKALADAKVYPTAQSRRWWTTDRLPFCMASKHHDNKLHLLAVNRNGPGKAVAGIAVGRPDKEEEIIPDGIAITDDMVYLVTIGGRILAFGSK